MYPDWPETEADLVPLPQCDGPKLAAFDFQGKQQIEFLEYLGEGLHAHVVKVRIKDREYALKLFRFVYDHDWYGPGQNDENEDRVKLTLMGQYSEPFNSECRAFGRLHETGHTELAVACYGYVLLDEVHEQLLADRLNLEMNGNCELPGAYDMRSRYLGERSGKPPPIRGILKELGTSIEWVDPPNLTVRDAHRILRDIIQLQQLGIFSLDVRRDQLINNKFCDFSVAMTVPHFLTNFELNPKLAAEQKRAMVHEAFLIASNDYWAFEEMIYSSCEKPRQTSKLLDSVTIFPGGNLFHRGRDRHHRLRSTSGQDIRVYSLVDPRNYAWEDREVAKTERVAKVATQAAEKQAKRTTKKATRTTRVTKATKATKAKRSNAAKVVKRTQGPKKYQYKIPRWPEKWHYDCDPKMAAKLRDSRTLGTTISWYVEDNLMHPYGWTYFR
ncbi:hypothetical protein SPBR_04998 [Sporothrix brasiliensis 5110]|uniref:Uncharacterized protein n=1 Tax=Sporothrix brasiliensis 5110 TaxID=1398154 RepID=A0A0C2IJW6_9PEZI|nr:uncharacterized protein SPBR_04998 [Sporothrix brasiliensis 5110]KIH87265.1 hypothetical protein SPBR_04998 [Sporothrix brasiliensis 5110]